MATPRHLSRAPITEALIDIRPVGPAPQVERLRPVLERELADYPTVEVGRRFGFRVGVAEGRPRGEAEEQEFYGFLFKSTDGLTITQVRPDGFTLNRLRPYSSWTEFLPEALRLWSIYARLIEPAGVARLGVRYINAIRLPLPIEDFSEYLTGPPPVPAELPQDVRAFMTRVTLDEPEEAITAIVTQALEPPAAGDGVSVILDIDVFQVGGIGMDADEIRGRLERLRVAKNRMFFGSITERTAEMFQ